MNVQPTSISRLPTGIRIAFSDGTARRYTPRELQKACPCANCREKQKADVKKKPDPLAILAPDQVRPPEIVGMRPVGHYAYHIDFSGGCSRGIYEFELLHALGHEESATESPA